MGVMRFLAPPAGRLANSPELLRAYLCGVDGQVFSTAVSAEGDTLVCRRESSESVRLHVPYPLSGFGRPVLCTGSLREQEEPYLLPVELARGRLGLIRDQLSAWEQSGMSVPEEAVASLREAQASFRTAACQQEHPETAAAAAEEALIAACRASAQLIEGYIRQRLAVRRRRSSHLPVLLGCSMGTLRPDGARDRSLVTAFTAAVAAVEWRLVEPKQGEYEWTLQDEQIAFAERNRLVAVAGPLLDFGPEGFPAWLLKWAHDFYALQSFVADVVETAVSRYAGRIRLWELAARPNTGGGLELSEEQRLTLAARAVETARQTDGELQISLRIDQPWGEYQAGGQHRLSPLQFADALIRSGVGLTGLTLEIANGYRTGGSHFRDSFELSRLIDLWSSLGLPLTIRLAAPSQHRTDANAEILTVDEPQWKESWSEPAQAAWLSEVFPLLMSKNSVIGIEWTHFDDAIPHRFPHAGLLRTDGSAKPALERLTRFRQSYWHRERHAG